MKQNTVLAVGTVVAALGASMCCILPVAVALLGVGSAAVGAKLEPARPYFTIATVLLLGFALYKTYQPVETCAPGERCEAPNQYRQRLFIWIAAVVALALLLFPYYAGLLF
jgi:mercuric ion transport protein